MPFFYKSRSDTNGVFDVAKKKSTRRRQPALDKSFEPPRYDDIDEVALEYRDTVEQRVALTATEVDLKTRVREAMRAHKLTKYAIPDTEYEVEVVVTEEKIRVAKKKEPKPDKV